MILQTKDLLTPLHHASVNGHLKVAELQIERCAEVDVRNQDQKTPLDLRVASGSWNLKLEARGCGPTISQSSNVDSQCNEASTLLRLGVQYRYLGLVDLLISSLVGLLVEFWANSRTPTVTYMAPHWRDTRAHGTTHRNSCYMTTAQQSLSYCQCVLVVSTKASA